MTLLRIENLRPCIFKEALSFELENGESIGLSGPSGSGKSLLLRAIVDLDVHEGEVLLDGVPRTDFSASEWRHTVGMLPPESRWWKEFAGEHLHSPEAAPLDQLGLTPSILKQPVSELSSGERQRLSLARLIANNQPRVLLLDEPTANLDAVNTQRIEALVENYRRDTGAGVIWVSHDIDQLQRTSDRQYRVEAGELHTIDEALQ